MDVNVMERRSFIAAFAALPALPRTRAAKRSRRPRGRGIILLASIPSDWHPTSWRDVPSSCDVIKASQPMAMASARSLAKSFNIDAMKSGKRAWYIVAATDGRKPKGGGA